MTIYAMNYIYLLTYVYGHNNETLNINLIFKKIYNTMIKYRKMHAFGLGNGVRFGESKSQDQEKT